MRADVASVVQFGLKRRLPPLHFVTVPGPISWSDNFLSINRPKTYHKESKKKKKSQHANYHTITLRRIIWDISN